MAKFDNALDQEELKMPLKCFLEKFSDETIDGKVAVVSADN